MSFVKTMGTHLSNKYGQKFLDSAKKSKTDLIKTASKRVIQKAAEATRDLIGTKLLINNKCSYINNKYSAESSDDKLEVPKKDIYVQKKGNKLLVNYG